MTIIACTTSIVLLYNRISLSTGLHRFWASITCVIHCRENYSNIMEPKLVINYGALWVPVLRIAYLTLSRLIKSSTPNFTTPPPHLLPHSWSILYISPQTNFTTTMWNVTIVVPLPTTILHPSLCPKLAIPSNPYSWHYNMWHYNMWHYNMWHYYMWHYYLRYYYMWNITWDILHVLWNLLWRIIFAPKSTLPVSVHSFFNSQGLMHNIFSGFQHFYGGRKRGITYQYFLLLLSQ